MDRRKFFKIAGLGLATVSAPISFFLNHKEVKAEPFKPEQFKELDTKKYPKYWIFDWIHNLSDGESNNLSFLGSGKIVQISMSGQMCGSAKFMFNGKQIAYVMNEEFSHINYPHIARSKKGVNELQILPIAEKSLTFNHFKIIIHEV